MDDTDFQDAMLEAATRMKEAIESEEAYQQAMHVMDNYSEKLLWQARRGLPERRRVKECHRMGYPTALEEALPEWIAALEKEIVLAKELQLELKQEVGE